MLNDHKDDNNCVVTHNTQGEGFIPGLASRGTTLSQRQDVSGTSLTLNGIQLLSLPTEFMDTLPNPFSSKYESIYELSSKEVTCGSGFLRVREEIRVSNKLSDLTGVGLELLVKNDIVLFRFFDGNILCDRSKKGNNEITQTL